MTVFLNRCFEYFCTFVGKLCSLMFKMPLLMNKIFFSILVCMFSISAGVGQEADYRDAVDFIGTVSGLTVSPDEKLWITTNVGTLYCAESIYDNWHDWGKPLGTVKSGASWPELSKLSFFNKDTAFFFADISQNRDITDNAVILTTTECTSWTISPFSIQREGRLSDAFTRSNGNIWICGSQDYIYYSDDYGNTWTQFDVDGVNSNSRLFMRTADEGVLIGSDHSYYTADNWNSYISISTPEEQGMVSVDWRDPNQLINPQNKIILWNNYLVIKQLGHVFYSDKSDVQWKTFPMKLIDFTLDEQTGILYAINDKLQAVTFGSPDEYRILKDTPCRYRPIDMQVANQSLFVLSIAVDKESLDKNYFVYKINSKEMYEAIPYTTDTKINPYYLKHGHQIDWGATNNQLYVATQFDVHNQPIWRREKILDFNVHEIRLLTDSNVVLRGGNNKTFLYSLRDHSVSVYYEKNPLMEFLLSPITSVMMEAGFGTCFSSNWQTVVYQKNKKDSFSATVYTKNEEEDGYAIQKTTIDYHNAFAKKELLDVLCHVDTAYYKMPCYQDFKDNSEDVTALLLLDTLSKMDLSEIFQKPESYVAGHFLTIIIYNAIGDSIHIRSSFSEPNPYYLPWVFTYRDKVFNCYNPEVTRFIMKYMPSDFKMRDYANISYLNQKIMDYLSRKRNE